MKRLLFVCLVSLLSCNCQNNSNKRSIVDDLAIDTSSYSVTNNDIISETSYDEARETLNDIRFAG
jgi:hypothetical protein